MDEGDRAAAVAAVRALLRIGNTGEDALIGSLVDEAVELAERFTGQVLIVRELRERVRGDGQWQRLVATPVRGVTAVEGEAGAVPVGDYAIDIDADGDGWVRVRARGVTVTLTAGLANDWAGLPAGLAGGVVRMAAHRFDARDEGATPPASVAALWRPWRRMRLK